ncbi:MULTISPECIES: Rnf-Nqr domain containing protein [Eubacteriales]|uniref:Na+-translocating ferredoxin:NAD+ oxidoreductase RNF, RnfE subunit n=1 Tax=Bittarella massiliensis (ex Durand et al. 2017) TaxID=1720313 RepID=A0AAQ1MEF0_9FIRM|nr:MULTISPECIES: Rnf-Nqr domain containing protein [Eubacteriales]ERI99033.1 hypothetical protein HMPREF0262_02274 [Clostridium sp. ATCC 29733]MZL70373.1 hypothetical protein [Bittarella massiliensis (ex Durand et al. 2017)]MZL81646.1 hypothetical protein [Bittarella massiliensis (ex Durand et al. 2017)]SHG31547.1 Na+-translocating ferredoxin:NAD+ oxidoreductase RNF, RnfE subunit [Bittarella massiliensis (ex Durand et al. 2017)]
MSKFKRRFRAWKGRGRLFFGRHQEDLGRVDGVFSQNPILMQGLALAPAIVATQSLKAGVILSLGFLGVVVPTILLGSLLFKKVDAVYRTILTALLGALLFVPVAYGLSQMFPFVSTSVGIYLPILIVDSIVVTKCSSYTHFGVDRYTFLDLFCTWLGFTLVVCVVGALREVLAYGRLWGITLKGVVPVSRSIALPFFGFFLIAVLAAGFRFLNNSFRHWINKKEGK